MSPTPRYLVRWTVIAAGVIAYPVLAHYSAATAAAATFPALGLTVALLPPLAILAWLAWHSSRRSVMLLLYAGVCLLVWRYREVLERHFDWVYFIQHAGTNLLLAAAFGRTLTRGRQPLCTRFAQAVRGHLNAEVTRYTRHVTLAWTLFFLVISLLSTLLFLFGSIQIWSVFANFLSLPLILFMFAAEHLVRRRRLPQLPQHSIQDSIRDSLRAFRNTPKGYPGASIHTR